MGDTNEHYRFRYNCCEQVPPSSFWKLVSLTQKRNFIFHFLFLHDLRLNTVHTHARGCVYIYICVYITSRPGVTAGKAAGMEVVAVPSLPKQSHLYTEADDVINSLLDLRPEKWGLPPFQDCKTITLYLFSNFVIHICLILIKWFSSLKSAGVEATLPLEPWHLGGPVVKGFGRGSKLLGIPTGNDCTTILVSSLFFVCC